MPRTPRKGTAVRIDEEHHKILRRLTNRTGKNQKELFEFLLVLCESIDAVNPGWQERLTASLERGRREIELRLFNDDQGRCVALANGIEKYKCVWGRKGKPPFIRLLETEYEASKELCLRCNRTLAMIEENEGLKRKNIELEERLKTRANVTFKVPKCNVGAILSEDGTEFRGCRKSPTVPVSVEKFCKVYQNGLPCAVYAESVIGVADGKSEYGSGINI